MTRLSARERAKAELVATIAARQVVGQLVAHGYLPRRAPEERCDNEEKDEHLDP